MSARADVHWPRQEDYENAIFAALDGDSSVLGDKRLAKLQPDRDKHENLRFITGGLAWVLPFTGNEHVVLKLFKKRVDDRFHRYSLISDAITAGVSQPVSTSIPPLFVSFQYRDKALAIDQRGRRRWYPGLVMDWCSGTRFDKYLEAQLASGTLDRDRECERWLDVVNELRVRGIAHGDLNHRNIYFSEDRLRLIDYDGMYVPAMEKHFGAVENGLEGYQRPIRLRDGAPFDAHMDEFSQLVVLTTLAGLSEQSWQFHRPDGLILDNSDLEDPTESAALAALARGPEPAEEMVRLLIEALDAPGNGCPQLDRATQLLGRTLEAPSQVAEQSPKIKSANRHRRDDWVWSPTRAGRGPATGEGLTTTGASGSARSPSPKASLKSPRRSAKLARPSPPELAALGRLAMTTRAPHESTSADRSPQQPQIVSLAKKFGTADPAELLRLVRRPADVTSAPLLTSRQQQALELRAAGAEDAQIAQILGIQVRTARRHVTAAVAQLHAGSEAEAVGAGMFEGLIDRSRGLAELAQLALDMPQAVMEAPIRFEEDQPITLSQLEPVDIGRQTPPATATASPSALPDQAIIAELQQVLQQKREDGSSPAPRRGRVSSWLSGHFGQNRPGKHRG